MMRVMVKKAIKLLLATQALIFMSYLYSGPIYANIQVAFLSSFFIMLGSFYAHNKMVQSQVAQKNFTDPRDALDIIDDPYELYDDEAINESEDLDLKQIVKEEKAKIKTLSLKTMKEGGKAGFSLFRLVPYVFLVLGFIALKNNNLLDISIYLPSILLGIIIASMVAKRLSSEG